MVKPHTYDFNMKNAKIKSNRDEWNKYSKSSVGGTENKKQKFSS